MKRNLGVVLALSALILTCGCKKSISPSSVKLTKGSKGSFPSDPLWQNPTIWGRVTRFDVGDGYGPDCILAYDCYSDQVSLTQLSGGNGTQLFKSYTGFNLVGGGNVPTNDWWTDISDQYAEFGGCHVATVDINKTGREDHILVYFPIRGWWWLLSYAGNGLWNNEGSGTTGIGGYDIAGSSGTDKIIAYDYGDGYKDALICYRPGNQFFWVLENTNAGSTSSSHPANWVAVVKSGGGVGGYDLKGTYDQIVTEYGGSGTMGLVCYRPGYGYNFWMTHNAYSTSWSTQYAGRSGFQNFPLNHQQDRLVNLYDSYGNDGDGIPTWYSPGNGYSSSLWVYYWEVQFMDGNYQVDNTNAWTFPNNPYTHGGVGDHVLSLSAGFSTTQDGTYDALLLYDNGGVQSQLYDGFLDTNWYEIF